VTTVGTRIAAPPSEVFDVITDPTTYPTWLVGAVRIRDVDPTWPQVGSAFRHLVGVPPLVVIGSTTSYGLVDEALLHLRAGLGPLGAADISFRLQPGDDGDTVLELVERFVAGPAGWTWRLLHPVVAALVWGRNTVSLEALSQVVEGRPR
jgi:hypothetical protein